MAFTKFGIENFMPVLCLIDNSAREKLHISQSIHSGVLTTFSYQNIDVRLRALIEYRIRNFVELNQIKRDALEMFTGVYHDEIPFPISLNASKCIFGDAEPEYHDPPLATKLSTLNKTFKLFWLGFPLSASVIGVEKLKLVSITKGVLKRLCTKKRQTRNLSHTDVNKIVSMAKDGHSKKPKVRTRISHTPVKQKI